MSKASAFIFFNGDYLPADTPVFRAGDRGVLYGDGLFETLRTYGGKPSLLERHIARMSASAAALSLGTGPDLDTAREAIARLLDLNGLRDAYIRITLTRGRHAGHLELDPPQQPSLLVVAQPLRPLAPERYDPGSTAIVASIRQNAASPLPRHKTLNYLANLAAKTEARACGADDAILLNTRGEVAEGASSNLFLVRAGRLITPALGANILPGVTRAEVLRIARDTGLTAEERTVWPQELASADEAFLTNSVAELVPVRSIDARPVGSGVPGPIFRQLLAAYHDVVV